MKRTLALLLTLALTLSCCAALAETPEKTELGTINLNGAFKLQCTLPEEYEVKIIALDSDGLLATVETENPAKPMMFLAIEFDELYYDVKRMNDMTDEQLQDIIDTFTNAGEEVNISYRETSHGTKLLVAQEASEKPQFVSFISVYEGYMIEFDVFPGVDAMEEGLAEAQIQMCIDFLSDLDFIPEEA